MENFEDNIKYLDEMTNEDLLFAVGSARFILEDLSIEKLAEVTGMPAGVIASAFDNIFIKRDFVRPSRSENRPRRLK